MDATSSARFVIRAATVAVLRTRKFIRHLKLSVRSGSRDLRYRIRDTAWGRTLWRTTTFARAPRERRRRLALADHIHTSTSLAMDPARGYRLLPPEHHPNSPRRCASASSSSSSRSPSPNGHRSRPPMTPSSHRGTNAKRSARSCATSWTMMTFARIQRWLTLPSAIGHSASPLTTCTRFLI